MEMWFMAFVVDLLLFSGDGLEWPALEGDSPVRVAIIILEVS